MTLALALIGAGALVLIVTVLWVLFHMEETTDRFTAQFRERRR